MNKHLLLLFLIFGLASNLLAESNNPKANSSSIVLAGNARFTVLTPQLIRMEWSEDAAFEDEATLTFINRALPTPAFKTKQSKNKVVITTEALTLTYKGQDNFSADNLNVVFKLNGKKQSWNPGMKDEQNLLGTCRTLDRANGANLREPLEKGILSRAGWTIVDDSNNHLLISDPSEWKEWVGTRREGETDWYLFAYGHDYKQALADYSKVAGRSPLPPKYAFGYWWSRYWQYSDNEFMNLVKEIRNHDLPMDVLIVDMDWHDTFGMSSDKNSKKDEYGQRVGWTGYTWQKELFPSPENFMKWVKRQHLKVSLNLHPASGIQPYESVYDAFTKAYGWKENGKGVPFHIDEKKWADTYFKTVLEPMEKMGVDFWWLDWQQWRESKFTKGLSNTFWLNYTFFHHDKKLYPEKRPMIYHRWGGLGSHRYQVAFSGDTHATWETLAFLPYFTATSSNVNYGYWGHDIGGHVQNYDKTNPEMYTRWLQYAVFTPIFKTHCTKSVKIERRIWMFPQQASFMRDAMLLRYALAPYIYNAARTNYDTGEGMCRPLYYDYPENEEAYSEKQEFMFGPDILATAIVSPADSVTGLAARTMWFPQGNDWYDMVSGEMIPGGTKQTKYYTLAENPYYVKAGAILPMNPENVKNLQAPCDTLLLTFIPGADGSLRYYEDDGVSQQYVDQYATTQISKKMEAGKIVVTIEPRQGSFANASSQRSFILRFPCTFMPQKVTVNGQTMAYSRFGDVGTWTYDGYDLAPVVNTAKQNCGQKVVVELYLDEASLRNQPQLYGKKGIFNRCVYLTTDFKYAQGVYNGWGMLPEEYLKVSQAPNFITENPAKMSDYLSDFEQNKQVLLPCLNKEKRLSSAFKQKLEAQLYGKRAE